MKVKLHQEACHAAVSAEQSAGSRRSNNATLLKRSIEGPQEQINTSTVPERTTMPRNRVTQPEERITIHGAEWVERDFRFFPNGVVSRQYWPVRYVTGKIIVENHGTTGLSPYDYFSWMFTMSHLRTIVYRNNLKLSRHDE